MLRHIDKVTQKEYNEENVTNNNSDYEKEFRGIN